MSHQSSKRFDYAKSREIERYAGPHIAQLRREIRALEERIVDLEKAAQRGKTGPAQEKEDTEFKSAFDTRAPLPPMFYATDCFCFNCNNKPELGLANPTVWRMFGCDICGNKRCPRGTDHRNACTNSNEPGQPGSHYESLPNPRRPDALD